MKIELKGDKKKVMTIYQEENLIKLQQDFTRLFNQMSQSTDNDDEHIQHLKDMCTADRKKIFQSEHHKMALHLEIAMKMGEK